MWLVLAVLPAMAQGQSRSSTVYVYATIQAATPAPEAADVMDMLQAAATPAAKPVDAADRQALPGRAGYTIFREGREVRESSTRRQAAGAIGIDCPRALCRIQGGADDGAAPAALVMVVLPDL